MKNLFALLVMTALVASFAGPGWTATAAPAPLGAEGSPRSAHCPEAAAGCPGSAREIAPSVVSAPGNGVSRELTPVAVRLSAADGAELVKVVTAARGLPPARRIAFVSAYFLGRKYHPGTRQRIQQQRAETERVEATNPDPMPVERLALDLRFLDCMTYVELVVALAASEPDLTGSILPRFLDVTYDGDGGPLYNHQRNHFATTWAAVNARKGYVRDVGAGLPGGTSRQIVLNREGGNRTRYVEDRFMIATGPSVQRYVTRQALLDGTARLESGDILACVTGREGLDVVHMGFFIERGGKGLLRHASYGRNRVVEEDLMAYLREAPSVLGLMVLRPVLTGASPRPYRFVIEARPTP